MHSYEYEEKIAKRMEKPWFPDVDLGVGLWDGFYEGEYRSSWLRWCEKDGNVIPTGKELSVIEHNQAEKERKRAEEAEEIAKKERLEKEKALEELRILKAKLGV